jgi:hypothetical protein
VDAPEEHAMTPQSWRYMVQVLTDMELQRELDDLGSAGWELVTAHWEEFSLGGRMHMQARCILKRPTDDDEEEFDESESRFEPAGIV